MDHGLAMATAPDWAVEKASSDLRAWGERAYDTAKLLFL
jgi:hypothetical protein